MSFTGWSQRDTLTTGHGHCRDNQPQDTAKAGRILAALRCWGLQRMHGFGFKLEGLAQHGHLLGGGSADSQAWSIWARRKRRPLFAECAGVHKNCASCLRWALRWRDDALAAAAHGTRRTNHQLALWEEAA